MLTLKALKLQQGTFTLTADVSLVSGSITALIGPSGCGKSTALAAIAGFLAPVSGKIEIEGIDITKLAPGDRPVSMLFQDHNLFPHLSVAQNVGLGLRPNLRLSAAEKNAVTQALEHVGLAGMHTRKPGALSGGQQSRVALARALLRNTPVMLLDEPFAALGPAMRAEMLDLVGSTVKANGTTALMVTHDPEDALRIADFTCVLSEGAIAPPTETKALFAAPPPALAAYLG